MLGVFSFSFPILINALIRQELNEEWTRRKSTSPWIVQRKWTGNNFSLFSIRQATESSRTNKQREICFYHPTLILHSELCWHRLHGKWILTNILKNLGWLHGCYVYRWLFKRTVHLANSPCLPEVIRPEEEPIHTWLAPRVFPLSIQYSPHPGTRH